MTLNRIIDGLYVGAESDKQHEGTDRIWDDDIDLVIDIRNFFDHPNYLAPDDPAVFHGCYPRFEKLYENCGLLASLVFQGVKIMIHCHGGIDRAPFVAAIIVRLVQGIPFRESYAFVATKRPQTMIHPEWIKWVEDNP